MVNNQQEKIELFDSSHKLLASADLLQLSENFEVKIKFRGDAPSMKNYLFCDINYFNNSISVVGSIVLDKFPNYLLKINEIDEIDKITYSGWLTANKNDIHENELHKTLKKYIYTDHPRKKSSVKQTLQA